MSQSYAKLIILIIFKCFPGFDVNGNIRHTKYFTCFSIVVVVGFYIVIPILLGIIFIGIIIKSFFISANFFSIIIEYGK